MKKAARSAERAASARASTAVRADLSRPVRVGGRTGRGGGGRWRRDRAAAGQDQSSGEDQQADESDQGYRAGDQPGRLAPAYGM